MRQPELSGDFATLHGMGRRGAPPGRARQRRHAARCAQAREFGAEGIGLCRTEHMFFEASRILAMREMILRRRRGRPAPALAKLLPMQRADFVELFEIMAGLPVTIRLLDPPLHEFLPHERDGDRGRRRGASAMPPEKLPAARRRAARVQPDARPSRLPARRSPIPRSPRCRRAPSSRRPCAAGKKTGKPVVPEIMIPLVAPREGARLLSSARSIAVAERGRRRRPAAASTIRSAP